MKINKQDLLLLETLTRGFYINTPANIKLSGEKDIITEPQHRLLCNLMASISLLASKGCLDKDTHIEIEESYHESLEEL